MGGAVVNIVFFLGDVTVAGTGPPPGTATAARPVLTAKAPRPR